MRSPSEWFAELEHDEEAKLTEAGDNWVPVTIAEIRLIQQDALEAAAQFVDRQEGIILLDPLVAGIRALQPVRAPDGENLSAATRDGETEPDDEPQITGTPLRAMNTEEGMFVHMGDAGWVEVGVVGETEPDARDDCTCSGKTAANASHWSAHQYPCPMSYPPVFDPPAPTATPPDAPAEEPR